MKLTVSKSKNSASFYVQKTIRKPNGSVPKIRMIPIDLLYGKR